MIKSGTGVIQRKHSKNYTSKQADARLKEVVKTYQEQGLRALEVDSFEVMYYPQAKGTTICTCKQTEILPQHSSISTSMPPTILSRDAVGEAEIRIDYNRPLFGNVGESAVADDETGDDEFAIDEGHNSDPDNPIVDSMFASSPDCGICYRTGYVPGFNLYGYERRVLTTHNMSDSYGYNLDIHTAPHTFCKLDDREGYVEFEIEIPKYFNSASVSVRNNTTVLEDFLYLGTGEQVTLADLKYNAGMSLTIKVLAKHFTHVVLEFDLGVDKVLSNLAQMSKSIDWTLFSTLGNMQIILPMTIAEVQAGDLIFIPKRNFTLKVTDVTYLRTAQERNLDWSVNTRVLQPQESNKYIYKSNKVR